MWKITLKGGEELIMTPQQYSAFINEYEKAKTSFTLVPLLNGIRKQKCEITGIEPMEQESDVGYKNIIFLYGTYRDKLKHNVHDWRDMLDNVNEKAYARKLENENLLSMAINYMDRFDKFPPHLQLKLSSPKGIYEARKELFDYWINNISETGNTETFKDAKELAKKFSVRGKKVLTN